MVAILQNYYSKGYEVHGIKRSSSINTSRIDHIFQDQAENRQNLYLHYGDLTDSSISLSIIKEILRMKFIILEHRVMLQ